MPPLVRSRIENLWHSHRRRAGKALLHTIGKCLQDRFTPEVRDAWGTVYNLIADASIRAAAPYYELAEQADSGSSNS